MHSKSWAFGQILVPLVFIAAILVSTPAAVACMGDCNICWYFGCNVCTVSGGNTSCTDCGHAEQLTQVVTPPTLVNFVGPRRVLITVQGYKSTNLQSITSCVVALSPIDGVQKVNSVTNLFSASGKRLPVTFGESVVPGLSLADIALEKGLADNDKAWNGFISNITGTVADNTPIHFVIDLTLKPGTSQEQFLANLRAQGVFVTSSSTRDGFPDVGHQYFRRLAATDLVVVYPEDRGHGHHPVQN